MKDDTLKLLFKKNSDIFERIKNEKMSCEYLKEDDVYLVTFGKPRASLGVDLDKNLVIHYTPNNHKIVGFTVTYCKEWFKANRSNNTNDDDGFKIDVEGAGGHFIQDEPVGTLEEVIKLVNKYMLDNEVEYGIRFECIKELV